MNSVPRVVHVIQHLAMGGMENGIVNLINYTPADRIAHAVVCLSHYTDFRARITNPDVPVVALHKQPGVDPAIYPRLWRTFRELRPDIVHSRNLPAVDCAPISRAAGVIAHVSAIADAADTPIILYNVPGRTGSNLTADTQLAVAERVP
ncbi:MAG TPA: dihydrodipicolinate synthase family protein, partial [Steroidobacteraceae bacterium]|nr:dihydrodipicolinate synthase family protein [Steroidobacteraceae bacterium]